MKLTRRTFFKVNAVGAATSIAGRARPASASTAAGAGPDGRAMLVDTTKCIGCRGCEAACGEANTLPAPAMAGQDDASATSNSLSDASPVALMRVFVPVVCAGSDPAGESNLPTTKLDGVAMPSRSPGR